MSMNRGTKIALIVGGIAATVIGIGFLVSSAAGESDAPICHAGWRTGGFHNWGWLMFIFMILLWGFAIWAIVSAVRWWGRTSQPEHTASDHDCALEILKRRYAAGEISREEFEAKKRDIA